MIEFEIPFVCLIFSLLIYFVYAIKERAKLEENSYFKKKYYSSNGCGNAQASFPLAKYEYTKAARIAPTIGPTK